MMMANQGMSSSSPALAAAAGDQQQAPLVLYEAVWIRRHADLRTETYWEGIVEYLGTVDFADGNDWIGIRLTGACEGLGKNNGTVQERSYFDAPPNCGLFVRQSSGVVQRRSLTKREEVRLRRELGIAVSPSSLATTTTMTATIRTPTATSRSTTAIMTATAMTTSPSRRPLAFPESAKKQQQQQQQGAVASKSTVRRKNSERRQRCFWHQVKEITSEIHDTFLQYKNLTRASTIFSTPTVSNWYHW
jgi:CAP-Gly domain